MERQLLELERGFWHASGDADFYRSQFADDGLCVFGFATLDKQATIESMTSSEPWATVDLGDLTFVELTPDAVALTYSASATREGQDPYDAAVSSVYVRRDGEWRLVLHQQTPRTPLP